MVVNKSSGISHPLFIIFSSLLAYLSFMIFLWGEKEARGQPRRALVSVIGKGIEPSCTLLLPVRIGRLCQPVLLGIN